MSRLDTDDLPFAREFNVITGFRANQSKVKFKVANCIKDTYVLFEHEDEVYQKLNFSRTDYVALVWDENMLVGKELRKSPSIKGMSGGAIFRIKNLPLNPLLPINRYALDCKLTAIIIKSRKPRGNVPYVIVGTRINYHLALIQKFFPDITLSSDEIL